MQGLLADQNKIIKGGRRGPAISNMVAGACPISPTKIHTDLLIPGIKFCFLYYYSLHPDFLRLSLNALPAIS